MSIKMYDKSGSTPQEVLLAGISPVDQILNGTSKNAIANKAVYNALADKIEVTVENLTNFYNKSQTYNKTEVRALVDAISTLTIEVVNSLPTQDISTTTIYFLKQSGTNVYDQYVYVNNAWVKIGDTQIDLSGYMTTAAFNIAIADYYDKSAIDTMIANYYTKTQVDNLLQNVEIDVDNELSSTSENPVQNKVIKAELDKKQGLIFTGTQAEWDALSTAQKTSYTFCNITDDTDYVGNIVDAITDGNMSAVSSNAVYDYPIDSVTDGEHRPPTSNAVYDKIAEVNNKLSTDYPKGVYANAIEYEKRNGICCISFKSAVRASSSYTLPDAFSTDLYLVARGTAGNSYAVVHMSNGHPIIEYFYDGTNDIYATITYPSSV